MRNYIFSSCTHTKVHHFTGQVKFKLPGISGALVMPFGHSGSRHTIAITVQMDRECSLQDCTPPTTIPHTEETGRGAVTQA